MNTINKKIKFVRERYYGKGRIKSKMCNELGVSPTAYQAYEKTTEPPYLFLKKLFKKLNIDYSYFIDDEIDIEKVVTNREAGSVIAEPVATPHSKPIETLALPLHDLDHLDKDDLDKVQEVIDGLIEDKIKERRRKRSGLPASEPDRVVPAMETIEPTRKQQELLTWYRAGIAGTLKQQKAPHEVSNLRIIELYSTEISSDQWLVNLLVDFDLPKDMSAIKGYKAWKKGNTNRWVPIAAEDISFIDERSFELLVRAKKDNPYVFKIQTVSNEEDVSSGVKSNKIVVPGTGRGTVDRMRVAAGKRAVN